MDDDEMAVKTVSATVEIKVEVTPDYLNSFTEPETAPSVDAEFPEADSRANPPIQEKDPYKDPQAREILSPHVEPLRISQILFQSTPVRSDSQQRESVTNNDSFRNVVRRKPRRPLQATSTCNEKLPQQQPPEPPEVPDDLGDSLHQLFRKRITTKLIGADRLKELEVHTVDMQRELEKVFTKYETIFEMNGISKEDPEDETEVETTEHVRIKANVLR